MTEDISRMSGGKQVKIDIQEIKTPELEAQLVAENVALAARTPHLLPPRDEESAGKRPWISARKASSCAWPAAWAARRISRAELSREGKTPLHTLRAFIDYGFHEANTLYGKIGVKVLDLQNGSRALPASRPMRMRRKAANAAATVDAIAIATVDRDRGPAPEGAAVTPAPAAPAQWPERVNALAQSF